MSSSVSKSTSRRINLSVPLDFYNSLTYVARRMGISSSSLVYNIASEAVDNMESMLRQVPEDGACPESTVRRLRGESVAYIQEQYRTLERDLDGGCDDNSK
jgi:predicted DNA-binding ribbon-helix-helix protein